MPSESACTGAGESMVSHRLECLHLNREEDAATITHRLVDFLLGGWAGLQVAASRSQENEG